MLSSQDTEHGPPTYRPSDGTGVIARETVPRSRRPFASKQGIPCSCLLSFPQGLPGLLLFAFRKETTYSGLIGMPISMTLMKTSSFDRRTCYHGVGF